MTDDPRVAVLTVALVRDDDERALLDAPTRPAAPPHRRAVRRSTWWRGAFPTTSAQCARRRSPTSALLDATRCAATSAAASTAPTSTPCSRPHGAPTRPTSRRSTSTRSPSSTTGSGGSRRCSLRARGVAAVLRRENGDVCLPAPVGHRAHPRVRRRRTRCRSRPTPTARREFRRFLRESGQRADTGIRIAHTLWAGSLPWARLLRTNAVDVHPVIAGIYGDCIFHLGAGSRLALFRADLARSPVAPHRPGRSSGSPSGTAASAPPSSGVLGAAPRPDRGAG